MNDLYQDAKYDTRNLLKARAGAMRVYGRLLRYAWHYKGRLLVSLFMACIVAACSSSMIVSVGAVVNLLFERDPQVVEKQTDTVVEWANKAVKRYERVTGVQAPSAGWSRAEVDVKVRDLLARMRDQRSRTIIALSIALLSLSFAGAVARFLQEYFAGSIAASVSVQLGDEMFENIMRLSIPFFERHPSGEILARFTNDIFMVNRGLASVFVKLFREPIKAVCYLALALKMDYLLTLTVLMVLPAIAYVIVTIGRKVKRSVRRSLQKIASMASVIAETLTGIVVVKAYSMEEYETGRVRTELHKLRRYLKRMVRADAGIEPATEFLMVLGVVLFMLLADRAFASGRVNGGNLVILFGALAALMDPLRKLASVNNMIQTSIASAERVFEFIDMRPDILEAPDAIALPLLGSELRFDHVHFSYNSDREVLKGISFEIKKGEMVALVGFSGAGKSTVVKLIPRFYDVSGGAVTIDGTDIRRGTFKSLRDQISIVTQDTVLFNESIRDNIAFGRTAYSDDRVREAAAAARASEFIERLPEQYRARIGESGGLLSGGQRQRLAIARAIIKDPAILILDEATSSLDSESEQAIQNAIEKFIVGRTTLVIAHRLSTIQRADRILVLDDGQIVEQGTHRELIAKGGLYRRLYDVQFASAKGDTT